MKTPTFANVPTPIPWYQILFFGLLFIVAFILVLLATYLIFIPIEYIINQIDKFSEKQAKQVITEMGPFPLVVTTRNDGTISYDQVRHVEESITVFSSLGDRLTDMSVTIGDIFKIGMDSLFGSIWQFLSQSRKFFLGVLIFGLYLLLTTLLPTANDVPGLIRLAECIFVELVFFMTIWYTEDTYYKSGFSSGHFLVRDTVITSRKKYYKPKEYLEYKMSVHFNFGAISGICVGLIFLCLVIGGIIFVAGQGSHIFMLALAGLAAIVAGFAFGYVETHTERY